jgi:hypothetical protein
VVHPTDPSSPPPRSPSASSHEPAGRVVGQPVEYKEAVGTRAAEMQFKGTCAARYMLHLLRANYHRACLEYPPPPKPPGANFNTRTPVYALAELG